jgi:hypothetical protein
MSTNEKKNNKGLFDEIVRTLFHVQRSYHLGKDTYDRDDRSIDHRFLQEIRYQQYRVHLEVHVYKHVFLKVLEIQNDVYVLYQLYSQGIDYQP